MTMGTLTQMLSLVSPLELQDLQEICEYNDITEEQLICAPETITHIEMFMQGIPQICCMSYFPNLVSLSLIHQNIPSIEGLHNCPCLHILRLNENVIDRIDGLQNCTRLVELYLHSNKIRYIKNVSHLRDLKVLWLANNNIHQVEGLRDCVQLKELNLAKNPISKLGDISNVKSLEKLNVAATNIGSFKEIAKLTKLKMLQDLRFLDYQWGKSPISLLHNYQTYVLFRLPNLCVLDAEPITEEDIEAARTTYTRKRVYYNMRIKSLRHRRNEILNTSSLKEVKQISALNRKFSELSKSRKDLEKNFFRYFEHGSDEQKKRISDGYSIFTEKAKSLDIELFSIIKQMDNLRKEIHENRSKEQASIDLWIHWVMVELDTGGNIRMEAGSVDQTWYNNCIELVTSRFSAHDFAPFGIIGVQPRKVSRIHNRFLQDRFERKTETKAESKHVEYLLYGETFQGSGELQWIVEEGFPFQSSKSKPDFHVPIILSNSIGLADVCRLQVMFDESQQSNFSKIKVTGWVLIVKAYLGISVQDQHVNDEFVNFSKSSYPDADSVYRIHPSDPTQRSWHIFDSSMLVPEYLVEYEYLLGNEPSSGHFSKEKEDGCLVKGKFVLPTSKLMSQMDTFIDGKHSVKVGHHSNDIKEIHYNSTHTPRKNPKSEFLNVTHLNLHSSNIHDLRPLKLLRKLKFLILSFNKISQIGAEFQELEELEILDLSYNLLRQFNGFIHLNQLKTLDLAGNQICTMDEIQCLAHQVSQLLHLNLRGNPIEGLHNYRDTVLKTFLYLTEFDCLPIDSGTVPNDKKKRVENFSRHGRNQMATNKEGLYHDSYDKTRLSLEPTVNHYDADIEELYFEHRNLKSLTCFEKLSNIRKLILSGNKISILEGLDRCTLLEELILEDNCIKQVKESMQLPMLWKLDLGRNEMTSCLQLHCFTGLSQLSIERNKIESLKGLSSLTALLELYAAHNLLWDAGEFAHLRVLPKLMVLDLSGNPLCEDPDYRSYAVFTLRKLKVLDSRVVDSNEIAEAQERHVGRLTKEMLQDFLGNCAFENLKTLNLSGKGLRNCGRVFESEALLGLEELDLSNNSLSSIKSLKYLRNLKRLFLQNNAIKDGPLLEEDIGHGVPSHSSGLITHENASNDVISVMSNYGEQLCLNMVEVLHLDSNSITNIMYLGLQKCFPILRLLSLKSNAIAKIDGLSGLLFLQKLYLDHNCIKEIEIGSFENLPSLEELHLSDNAIKTVQHLWQLTSLKTLNLSLNYIKSDRLGGFQVIKELAALNMLEDLSLSENPICRHPQYRCTVISKLLQLTTLDGCLVSEEDLADAELYANGGSDRIHELIQQDNNNALHQNEFQSSSSVSSYYQGFNGKVALKAKPFNFEAMSCVPKTIPQGPVHRSSLDFPELVNNSHTYRSTTPRNKTRHEGENNRGSIPPGLMRNFRKFS